MIFASGTCTIFDMTVSDLVPNIVVEEGNIELIHNRYYYKGASGLYLTRGNLEYCFKFIFVTPVRMRMFSTPEFKTVREFEDLSRLELYTYLNS